MDTGGERETEFGFGTSCSCLFLTCLGKEVMKGKNDDLFILPFY